MKPPPGTWSLLLCLTLFLHAWGPVFGSPNTEQLQQTLSPAAAQVQLAWQRYFGELGSVQVDGKPLLQPLTAFRQFGFTLTPYQLQRALVNNAKGARLRRLVRRQLLTASPKPLKIGVIGTSVSWGTGPSDRGTTDYVSMLPTAIQMVFPQSKVQSRNGCSPGTGSGFANMCLSYMVDEDVDLVVMEFVTNDFVTDELWNNTHTITYERLVRKALGLKSKPVVVFVQVPTWGQMFNTSRTGHKLWHQSAELLYGPLAQYYGIPVLSFRNAWWHDAEARTLLAPGGWDTVTSVDQVHPNDLGHRSILDMILWLLLQTALDLQINPMTRREVVSLGQPLPEPMHPGNYEEGVSLCVLEDQLRSVVNEVQSAGWSLVNEGTAVKKKIGFVSTTPGSVLHITLNLGGALGNPTSYDRSSNQLTVGVAMAYLQSYTNMGQASWTCVQGCVCQPRVFDAHHTQQTSTSFMALMPTNATAPLCQIELQVLTNTSSGGHKFKVSGLMLSRLQEMGFHWSHDHSHEWKNLEMVTERE